MNYTRGENSIGQGISVTLVWWSMQQWFAKNRQAGITVWLLKVKATSKLIYKHSIMLYFITEQDTILVPELRSDGKENTTSWKFFQAMQIALCRDQLEDSPIQENKPTICNKYTSLVRYNFPTSLVVYNIAIILVLAWLVSRHRARDLDAKRGLMLPSPLYFRGKGNSSHTSLLLLGKRG